MLETDLEGLKDLLSKKNSAKKKKGGKFAIGAGIGTLIGVGLGMLFAPKSGKETREEIAEGAKNTADAIKTHIDIAKEKIADAARNTGCCCCSCDDEETEDCCGEDCCEEEKQNSKE